MRNITVRDFLRRFLFLALFPTRVGILFLKTLKRHFCFLHIAKTKVLKKVWKSSFAEAAEDEKKGGGRGCFCGSRSSLQLRVISKATSGFPQKRSFFPLRLLKTYLPTFVGNSTCFFNRSRTYWTADCFSSPGLVVAAMISIASKSFSQLSS